MNYRTSLTDLPRDISKEEDDQFGIDAHERGLIQFIEHSDTPITIALQGEWGSGKTSLMYSLNNSLGGDEGKFHTIWLNTWEYALMNDPAYTLMDIVMELIRKTSQIAEARNSSTEELKSKLGNLARNLGRFATTVATDKLAGGASADIVKEWWSPDKNSSIGDVSKELQAVIDKSLLDDPNKSGFIFFIDDLDRVDPPVAVQLLELLKNIFTLNQCIFILAIDYDVVVKGLEPKFGKLTDANEREFRSFFDKIIQVPFSMPVSTYEISRFLGDSLVRIGYLKPEAVRNETIMNLISEFAGLSVGTNPRALKRLLNFLSLIKCINASTNKLAGPAGSSDETFTNVVNFALVSIQIAYPKVYNLLSSNPGFDKWNDLVANKLNLKPLDENKAASLNSSDAFDDDWEKVVYQLCATDYYLKKRAHHISQLLNELKAYITNQKQNVEHVIDSAISMSAVTNLDKAERNEEVEFHKGQLLKNIGYPLLENLRLKLPQIASEINQRGKRVQSNFWLDLTADGHNWLQLLVHPHEGKIRLIIHSYKWLGKAVHDRTTDWQNYGVTESFQEINQAYKSLTDRFRNLYEFDFYDLEDPEIIEVRDRHHSVQFWIYFVLPDVESFQTESFRETLSDFVAGLYPIMAELGELDAGISDG